MSNCKNNTVAYSKLLLKKKKKEKKRKKKEEGNLRKEMIYDCSLLRRSAHHSIRALVSQRE